LPVKCGKTFGGGGFAPDSTAGANSAPPDSLAVGEGAGGWLPAPQKPHLRARRFGPRTCPQYCRRIDATVYMGCSDVSEFEDIYGQMSTTPSCVYDPSFKEQEWWLLMR